MEIGYVRISAVDQNESRQLENIKLEKKFIDKCSGKNKDRPALTEMLDFAREGDVIIVHSIDRLARNLSDLKSLIDTLIKKGISIKFIKENLEFNGTDNALSKLMLNMMGSFAEFERELIRERQREGIELAKRKGIYKGRKKALDDHKIIELLQRLNLISNSNESALSINKSALAREYGINRATLDNYNKKYQYLLKDAPLYQMDIKDFYKS